MISKSPLELNPKLSRSSISQEDEDISKLKEQYPENDNPLKANFPKINHIISTFLSLLSDPFSFQKCFMNLPLSFLKALFIYITFPLRYITKFTGSKISFLFINSMVLLFMYKITCSLYSYFDSIRMTLEIDLPKFLTYILSNNSIKIHLSIIFKVCLVLLIRDIFFMMFPGSQIPKIFYNGESEFPTKFNETVGEQKVQNHNTLICIISVFFTRLCYGKVSKMKMYKGIHIEIYDNRHYKLRNVGRFYINKVFRYLFGENLFSEYSYKGKQIKSDNDAIFLCVHGLNSSSNSKTITSIVCNLPNISVAINLRGMKKDTKLPKNDYNIPHIGFIGDIEIGMDYINEHFPNREVVLLGCSLGGNLIVNAMHNFKSRNIDNQNKKTINYKTNKIIGAIGISPALDFIYYSQVPTTLRSQLFMWTTLATQKEFFKSHPHILLDQKEKHERLLKNEFSYTDLSEAAKDKLKRIDDCKSLYEVDTILLKDYQATSLHEHYSNVSSINKLDHLDLPILIIHSENDSVLPTLIPYKYIYREGSNLVYVLLKRGEHLLHYDNYGNYSLSKLFMGFLENL